MKYRQKSVAANLIKIKAALEIEQSVKILNKSAVQFTGAVCPKRLTFQNAYTGKFVGRVLLEGIQVVSAAFIVRYLFLF